MAGIFSQKLLFFVLTCAARTAAGATWHLPDLFYWRRQKPHFLEESVKAGTPAPQGIKAGTPSSKVVSVPLVPESPGTLIEPEASSANDDYTPETSRALSQSPGWFKDIDQQLQKLKAEIAEDDRKISQTVNAPQKTQMNDVVPEPINFANSLKKPSAWDGLPHSTSARNAPGSMQVPRSASETLPTYTAARTSRYGQSADLQELEHLMAAESLGRQHATSPQGTLAFMQRTSGSAQVTQPSTRALQWPPVLAVQEPGSQPKGYAMSLTGADEAAPAEYIEPSMESPLEAVSPQNQQIFMDSPGDKNLGLTEIGARIPSRAHKSARVQNGLGEHSSEQFVSDMTKTSMQNVEEGQPKYQHPAREDLGMSEKLSAVEKRAAGLNLLLDNVIYDSSKQREFLNMQSSDIKKNVAHFENLFHSSNEMGKRLELKIGEVAQDQRIQAQELQHRQDVLEKGVSRIQAYQSAKIEEQEAEIKKMYDHEKSMIKQFGHGLQAAQAETIRAMNSRENAENKAAHAEAKLKSLQEQATEQLREAAKQQAYAHAQASQEVKHTRSMQHALLGLSTVINKLAQASGMPDVLAHT